MSNLSADICVVGTTHDRDDNGTLLERLRTANCYRRYAEAVRYRTNGK